ncbi:Helicase SEN1 [Sesamum angolense]|uniref:Helicase SEN1 n=1 Tax=Sesamum angolense TaxID=2727404 RepID=A0AAE2BRC9_9LAMI|nr:Helicase SEN1 [Sesamum angolense]
MGPLLETFYNYFKEECHDSPLKLLWNRISQETRNCTLCIHQHHQAQQMYDKEYEESCISPLLDVLRMLDEERISQHLKDLNARIAEGEYDAGHDYAEVVSVMFEVQLDSVLLNFQALHHLFFILCKLLKEGNSSPQTVSQDPSNVSDISKFYLQGGFLKQPVFDSSPTDGDCSSFVSLTLWKKFSCSLSEIAWPSILKCLDGGKTFTDYTVSQMTCIRLLEVMPVVLERLPRNSSIMLETFGNTKWLHDLADWGKSSLAVVVRYWKQTLAYLLGHIKACCSDKSASAICDVEKLISYEKVSIDEVSKQVARLSVSLTDEGSTLNKIGRQSKCSPSGESLNRKNCSAESEILIVDETKMNSLNSEPLIDLEGEHVIVLSDDEKQGEISAHMGLSSSWATTYGGNHAGTDAAGRELKADLKEEVITHGGLMVSPGAHHQLDSSSTDLVIEKMSSDNNVGIQISQSSIQSEPSASKRKKVETEDGVTNSFLSTDKSNLSKLSDGTVNSEEIDSFAAQLHSRNAFPEMNSASNVQQSLKKPPKTSDETMKELVCDTDDNAWKFSFFKPPRRHQTLITKPSTSVPKRQVIQLTSPVENRPGSMRLGAGVQKRFQPPRLDDWYRPILQLDFFVAVGLASGTDKDNQNVGKLKEVPVCFESPDGYVEIFRPLVLEEFKAQLQSSYQEMASAEEMSCGSLSVLSVERIDDFHVVRFVHDEDESAGSKSLSENDLILLTRQPLRNSNCDTHTVGKYRMHPEICRFPSLHFYEGKLLNGDQMSDKAASFHGTGCLGPYVFFDIIDGQELRGKNAASLSLYNEAEAEAAVEVLRFFRTSYPKEFSGGRIGIITPYKRQLSLLHSRFSSAFGPSITAEMEFNTVDGFQGREVDILLLSTVRAAGSRSGTARVSSSNLGFVADVRRMNVALTRAKLSLWIFGHARTLQTNQSWAALLEDAQQRNLIVSGKKPYSSIYKFGLENRPSGNSSKIQLEEVERIKPPSECVNTQKKVVKHISERKRRCLGAIPESIHTGEGGISSSTKDAAKDDQKKARDGTNVSMKEVASAVIPNSDNKVLKGAKSKLEEDQVTTDKSWACRSNDKQINVKKAGVGKGNDIHNIRGHSAGKVKSGSQKHQRLVADEMCSKTFKHDKLQQAKAGASLCEGSSKEKGEQGASTQVEVLKDSIMKRKQQREAVDALLSSALISSKKSESSVKSSAKRTLSTSNTSCDPIRPQKRVNG